MHDLYAILGLSRRATSDEIRAEYWALAKRYHPDINSADKQGEWLIKEINHAYAILGNPEARTAYDRDWRTGGRSSARLLALGGNRGNDFFVTASSVWVMVVMWKQTVSIYQSQMSEPAVLVRDAAWGTNSPSEVVAIACQLQETWIGAMRRRAR